MFSYHFKFPFLQPDICLFDLRFACNSGQPARYFPFKITWLRPPPVPTLTGNETPCSGIITYVYTTESGMTNYSWNVTANGTITSGDGTNSISVSWITDGPGTVSINYVNSSGCTAANPTVLNIDVQTNPATAVTITPSANPICSGTSVTYTAVAVNGGTTPGFDWKVNGIIVSSSASTYTYNPVNGDHVVCQVTSSLPCSAGNIVNSNEITMAVSSNAIVAVNISPSSNPVCQGLPVTMTATATNGGTNPSFQWKLNGLIVGSNSSSFTFIPGNNDFVTCSLSSSLGCATGNPAISNTVVLTVSSALSVSVSIAASANPSCSGSLVTYTATPVNGGSSPVYHWKVNGLILGSNSPVFSYSPQNNDVMTCEMISSISCPSSGATVNSNSIIMTVNTASPLSVTISPSVNPVCQGAAVTLTATCINGGIAPDFSWNINGFFDGFGSTYTYFPSDHDIISCFVTSDLACVTGNPAMSNEVTMLVNAVLSANVSITASSNPVCQGTPVTYTAAAVNGGINPQYHWRRNGLTVGSNSSTCIITPTNNDLITCELVPDVLCFTPNPVISNSILMSVSPVQPVSIIISTGATPLCLGEPMTFTAAPVNAGFSPVFNWRVNGFDQGGNSISFTYVPALGDVVNCILSSNMNCVTGSPATSNSITPGISQNLPVGVEIQAASNQVCEGENVTITATPTNGGTTPVYHWIVNGVNLTQGMSTFSYLPANNDIVKCQLTSSLLCASGNPATSNEIPITVFPIKPVSVSITCSANPVCQGSTVNFTATPTNGGTLPVYQWQVNGNPVGINSSTYSYIPQNGDVIFCKLTSDVNCPSSATVSSNNLVMNVFSDQPASISIVASRNPSCDGNPVTFTATALNAGNSPVYNWKVNNIAAGTNSASFIYTPVNGDLVNCTLTSSNTCSAQTSSVSNTITMAITPRAVISISITSSANPVCVGTPVTFNATTVSIGSIVYQWKINNVNVGTNSPTFTYIPINGDKVTCWLNTSATCIVGNGIECSNEIRMVVNSQLTTSLTITATANPVCTGSPVTFQALPVNGGSAPVYQWKVNGSLAGTNNAAYTYIPVNGDIISCKIISNMNCVSPDSAWSNMISMNVTPKKLVDVAILSSMNPACPNVQVDFSATPTNGGTSPVYIWKVNGTVNGTNSPNFSYLPLTNDVITCQMTSNMSCITGNPATSAPITMSVLPGFPAGVSVHASANPFCEGTPVIFTAVPVNGGSSPSYQWMVNSMPVGPNAPIFTFIPLEDDVVSCSMVSSWSCALGNPAVATALIMSYIEEPDASVSVVPSDNSVCIGTTVSYTAIPYLGGESPQYVWYVNNDSVSANSPTYSYIPVDGDNVNCTMKSSIGCLNVPPVPSNLISMVVNPITDVSVTISPSQNGVCQQTPIMFTAVPHNGGTNPSFVWKVNGIPTGGNMSTFTYAPFNNDTITCVLTSNINCPPPPVTSNSVIMTVYPETPDAVTVSANMNPACTGSIVTFTAVPVNASSSSVYEWRVNGNHVGTNQPTYSYLPNDGDIIKCIFYSNGVCYSGVPANSDPVIMMIDDVVPVSVEITTTTPRVCAGSEATFESHVTNGSSNMDYEWLVNGIHQGSDLPSFTYVPANHDRIECRVTHTMTCSPQNPVTSDAIFIDVDPMGQAGISIASSVNPVCSGNSIQLTATPVNGGTTPVYQWVVNNVNVGTTSPTYSYIPTNGNTVTCRITSNANCLSNNVATSAPLNITVNPFLQVFVSITASSNPVCENKMVTFTSNISNGGTLPVYQWKINGLCTGTNSSSLTLVPQNNDIITCQLTSNVSCPNGNPYTSNPIALVVTPARPAEVAITPTLNPVCQGTSVSFSAAASNGGNSPTYQWIVNNLPVGTNSPAFSYIPQNNDVVKCTMTSNALCSTNNPATSVPLTMNVSSAFPVSIGVTPSANPACQGSMITYTASGANGGNSPNYQWRVNNIVVGANQPTFTFAPTQNDIITCYFTSDYACATGNPAASAPIQMVIHNNVTPSVMISGSANPVCQGTNVSYTANATSQGTTPTYQWKVNNINAGTNNTTFVFQPADNDIVSCSLLSSELCAAPNPAASNSIQMRVSPEKQVGISITTPTTNVCLGTTVSLSAASINGGTAPQYSWKVNGLAVGGSGTTFSYIPANGDRISCQLISNIMCAAGNPATSNEILMNVSSTLPVSVNIVPSSNPSCIGQPVTVSSSASNGGNSPVYEWRRNGFIVGQNLPDFTFTPSDGDIITCRLTSDNNCATGNPAVSNSVRIAVVSMMNPVINISSSSNPVCLNTTVNYTALISDGGSSPAYQWFVNNIPTGTNSPSYSYLPAQGDLVACKLTTVEACAIGSPATSNPISMVVSGNLPVSLAISSSSNNICQGTTISYTANSVNGGPFPSYQWNANGTDVGTNSPTYSYTPSNNDVVNCKLTSSLSCATQNPANSNSVTMRVSPVVPVSLTVTPSLTTACQGTQISYSAAQTNGGSSPVYQWKSNGINVGTNDPLYTCTPNNGDVISCVITSNVVCASNNPASSNPVTASIFPIPVMSLSGCFDPTTMITAPAFKLKGGLPLGGTYSGPGVDPVTGTFNPGLAGPGTKTITYSYTNAGQCSSSASRTIVVTNDPAFTCGDVLTDSRELTNPSSYPTIKIGNQCWMASNLNYGTFLNSGSAQTDNCQVEKYCYNDNETNCSQNGGLYQWDELLKYSDAQELQGICPPGWHIPTETEWNELFNYYNGKEFAGAFLMASSPPAGFNAKPAGVRYNYQSWSFVDFATLFWTSTRDNSYKALANGMNKKDKSVSLYSSTRGNAFSVRCIKD